MSELKWTSEKPKEAKPYFYRDNPQAKRKIVELEMAHGGVLYCLMSSMPVCIGLLHGQWSGPIPEPTEPTPPHYIDPATLTDLNQRLK